MLADFPCSVASTLAAAITPAVTTVSVGTSVAHGIAINIAVTGVPGVATRATADKADTTVIGAGCSNCCLLGFHDPELFSLTAVTQLLVGPFLATSFVDQLLLCGPFLVKCCPVAFLVLENGF